MKDARASSFKPGDLVKTAYMSWAQTAFVSVILRHAGSLYSPWVWELLLSNGKCLLFTEDEFCLVQQHEQELL